MEKNQKQQPSETVNQHNGRIRITEFLQDERVRSVALVGGVLLGIVGSMAEFTHSGNPQTLAATGIGVAFIFSLALR